MSGDSMTGENDNSSIDDKEPAAGSSGRRGLTIGLAAGLLSGAAAGMVFGVPGLTSAAQSSVDVAQVDVAQVGVVQQADDETEADPETVPGDRLRESLQDLVDDGTLTAEQADAVAAHLVEEGAGRFERRHERRQDRRDNVRELSEAVVEVIGLDAEEIRTRLRAGESLADIATANGVDTRAVVDVIVAEGNDRIDQAVTDGKIDEERAAELRAELEDRVAARVNGERPQRPSQDRGRHDGGGEAENDAPEITEAPETTEN